MLSKHQFKTVHNAVRECKHLVITVTWKLTPSSTQLMLSNIAFLLVLNAITELIPNNT